MSASAQPLPVDSGISAIAAVRHAMERLDHVRSVQGLLDVGAQAACELGFDRAMVSRVNGPAWVLMSVYMTDNPVQAAKTLRLGQAKPERVVPGLPEYEIWRRQRPIVVSQLRRFSRLHPALATGPNEPSYVAAGVFADGKVVGFIHADRHQRREPVSQADCELLATFARAFGFALERAALQERVDDLRGAVEEMVGHLDADPVLVSESWQRESARRVLFRTVEPSGAPALNCEGFEENALTTRETEVLAHIARGDSNARIADMLAISTGTVKSHVKNIFRKLGAANRAEAVAVWHRARESEARNQVIGIRQPQRA